MRCWKSILLLLFLLAGDAFCQSPGNQLLVGETLQMMVPGAFAGFARPGSCAKVEVDDGVVEITGKFPGTADIVLITRNSTRHLQVTVLPERARIPVPAGRSWSLLLHRKTEKSNIARSVAPPTPVVFPVPIVPFQVIPLQMVPPPVAEQSVEDSHGGEKNEPAAESIPPAAVLSASQEGAWSSTGTAGISLQERQTIRVAALDATAAYAIDSLHVNVAFDQGFAMVTGKFAGHSQLIIVSDAGVKTIPIEVTPAPPLYPKGFIPPEFTVAGRISGAQEVRYLSDQQQIQNLVDYTVQGPQRSTQLHLLTSTFAGSGVNGSRMLLPSAFYRIRTPNWDITLLDQQSEISPLTLHGSMLRGLHVSSGRWRFHGGYSSLAMFHNFLIPIQREGVVGASYVAPLTGNSQLTSNVYYFFAPTISSTTGRTGAVASLAYEYHRKQGLHLLAELAASRGGPGGAVQFRQATSHDTLIVNLRATPQAFPSLSIDNNPGLQSNVAWTHQFNARFANNFNFSDQRLLFPFGRQNNLVATENVQGRISRHWSASSGVSRTRFDQTGTYGTYSFASLNLPQSINFDLPHFGTGFQYQYSRNSNGVVPGNDLRQTVRASAGAFSASAYVERQTQGLSVESLYSQIPSLQSELLLLGLSASTPQEIQALLQDTSFLLALGLSPGAQLNLVPSRIQAGGNLHWFSHNKWAEQLDFSVDRNQEESLLGRSTNWTVNSSYSMRLSRTLSVESSFALLHVNVAGRSQSYPQFQIGLRHVFSTLPSFLAGYKSGNISGTIFEDEAGQGKFHKGLPTIPGVEVVLDHSRRITTDRHGFYSFQHVKEGEHVVEVHFQSSKPFWFTDPSRFVTSINQQENVGIRYASAELVGYLKNAAGAGVGGARVAVAGNNQRLDTESDAVGRFMVSGLAAGEYEVTVNPDTLPAGYLLENLKPQHIQIKNGTPGRVDFHVEAMRSITGLVTVYDVALGKYVPAAGVPVQLRQPARTTLTNSAGRFDFQNLPAGEVALLVGSGKAQVIRNVTVPPEPSRILENVHLRRKEAGQ